MIKRDLDQQRVTAEYFYLGMSDTGKLAQAAFANAHDMINPMFVPQEVVYPKRSVRVIATVPNVPAILAAGDMYNAPVEYCSPILQLAAPPQFKDNSSAFPVMVDIVHQVSFGLPTWDPRNFRIATEKDMYQFGLCYHVCRDRLNSYKLNMPEVEELLSEHIDQDYTDFNKIKANHVMGDYFDSNNTMAADLCAAVIDPRMCLDFDGRLMYKTIHSLFNFSTMEVGVRVARLFVDMYGSDKLPYNHTELRNQYLSMTGADPNSISMPPPQLLGIRVFHRILTTPLDDLGIVPQMQGGTLARDVDLIQRYLHRFFNEWLERLNIHWDKDVYVPEAFKGKERDDVDDEEEHDDAI